MGGSLLKLMFSVMGWTSRTRLQHAFRCSASSRIGGRRSEAITTTWPLPIDSLPGRGAFPANGLGVFLCLPCGGAPSVMTIVAQKTFALARGTSCPSYDALHLRRRISRCLARCRAAPPGLSKDLPLRRHHLRCPLPASVAAPYLPRERYRAPRNLRRRAPQPSARSVLVVLHHLDGLLHRRLAGLLHPATDPGVHRVSALRRLPTGLSRFPSDATPSRAYPLAKPLPCHQGPLPSCRSRSASPLCGAPVDFKVLLRASVRSVGPPLPDDHARSSHGLPAPEASCSAFNHALRAARRSPEDVADAVALVPLLPSVLGGRPQLPSPALLFDQHPRGSGSGRPCRRPRPPTLAGQLDIKHRLFRLMACLCHVMPDPCSERAIPGFAPSRQPRSSATPLHPLAGGKTTAHCEEPGHAGEAPRAPHHTSTYRSPAARRHTFADCARGSVPSSNSSIRRSIIHRLPGYRAPYPDSRRLRGSALAPASLRDPTSGSKRPGIAVPRGTSWSSAPPHLPSARCRAGSQHRTRAGS